MRIKLILKKVNVELWYIKVCLANGLFPYPRKFIDDINDIPFSFFDYKEHVRSKFKFITLWKKDGKRILYMSKELKEHIEKYENKYGSTPTTVELFKKDKNK